MVTLPFIQDLRLLPQAGRGLPQIIRAAEVYCNLFPEIFAHIDNIGTVQAQLF
ncbi:hypothetical protein D3C80_2066230 [compost metagenome]